MPSSTPLPRATAAVDLGALPLKPSRVLADFSRRRAQQRAEQETARLVSQMRGTYRVPVRVRDVDAGGAPAFARRFEAADTGRLTAGWGTHSAGIMAELEVALEAVRARSRDWAVNTDAGRRYVSLVQDNVVGAHGVRLQMRVTRADGSTPDERANTAVERAWAEFCRPGRCDVSGRLSFVDLCRIAIAAVARDGECLLGLVRDRAYPHGLAVQALDVDRILNNNAAALGVAPGNAVRMGIEHTSVGRMVAVHVHAHHPGDSGAARVAGRSQRLPASAVVHAFISERPEQLRGYPWTAAILQTADGLATYKRHALVAAKIGAAKMGFYTVDKDAVGAELGWDQLRDATGNLVQDVEAGMLEALPPGVGFQSFNPDYPHQNFDAFVAAYERGLAAGLNVAHHNLTGNMSGVNYSSARIAELAERSHWRALQRWFVDAIVNPIFTAWLERALLMGAIVLPSGRPLGPEMAPTLAAAATWQPRSWAWVDPRADGDAAVTALSNDMRSLRQITDEQGTDLEEVLIDKARLVARYRDEGLPMPAWLQQQAAVAAADAAAEPDGDEATPPAGEESA